MSDVTRILAEIESGDPSAAEQLLPMVYDELRKLAAQRLASERPGQTLQATALVHEAYLRLVDVQQQPRWDSRGHFFAAASEAMRRILVDQARRRQTMKHGGQHKRLDVDEATLTAPANDVDLIALDEALERLEEVDGKAAELVKLKYFSGLTVKQVAEVMGMSTRSAERLWTFAKAWLYRELAAS